MVGQYIYIAGQNQQRSLQVTAQKTPAIAQVLDIVKKEKGRVDNGGLETTIAQVDRAKHLLEPGVMFGIESVSRPKIEKTAALAKGLAESVAKQAEHGVKYIPLSLEPLKWRHDRITPTRSNANMPMLVIYGLDSPNFKITARHQPKRFWRKAIKEHSIEPKLPEAITKCYDDVVQTLLSNSEWQEGLPGFVSCTFTGMIPDDVKSDIRTARKIFGEHVYIIAEPSKWEYSGSAMVMPGDPLVVGWDGERLWFVREFDTTPVEEAMMLVGPKNT